MMKTLGALTGLLALAPLAWADEPPAAPQSIWNWTVDLGLTFGGDKLAAVKVVEKYSDRHYTQDIRGGGKIQFDGGVRYRAPGSAFSVITTAGYHADDISGDNGSVRFSRYPLELTSFYHFDSKHSLGAGLRYDSNVSLNLSDVQMGTQSYKNAFGYLIEYGFTPTQHVSVGLRYTVIEYEVDSVNGNKVASGQKDSGNHVGINARLFF